MSRNAIRIGSVVIFRANSITNYLRRHLPGYPLSTSLALRGAPITWISVVFALVGCSDLPDLASCSASDPCPSGSWCRSGHCVSNAAPVAVIEPPDSTGSNRPLLFRGTASHDDDPGDTISAWSWRVSPPAGSSGCEPFPGTGTGADFSLVFPCPGEHEVSLFVVDSLGTPSSVRTLRVRVEATTDPPLVALGGDVSVEHRCSGPPVSCTPWDGLSPEVALSAIATGPAGVGFTYRWSVELPPELVQQPPPKITFSPADTVAEPDVRIETAGTAIAGRYTFVVTATDSRGMVAVGRQQVDVGNRPPVVTGGGRVLLPHGYEAATGRFVASGETPAASWSDPDGDPVTALGFTATRSGDGGNVFDVQDLVDRARLTVVVPYAKPSDAALLIGPGVSRRVELVVADVNGARATAAWSVEVANRPPRLTVPVATTSVDHTYEASFLRYAAQAGLSTWVDDDGDPLLLSVGGDPSCIDVVGRQGTAWVTCSSPFEGRPDPGRLVGNHPLAVSAADPFESGPSQQTVLEIRNRPPRLTGTPLVVTMPCRVDRAVCCISDPQKGTCLGNDLQYMETSLAVGVVVDDDGDPLDLAAGASDGCLAAGAVPQPCVGPACSVVLTLCGNRTSCGEWAPGGSLSVTASDGLASMSGPFVVQGDCAP